MNITVIFNPFFEEQPFSDVKQEIHLYGSKVYYPKNTNITSPGEIVDTLYYIEKGRVNYCYFHYEGEEKTLLILQEGSFFNEPPLLDPFIANNNSFISVTTAEKCILYKIDKETFNYLYKTSDTFRNSISSSISKKLYLAFNHVVTLSFSSCEERLYQILVASKDLSSCSPDGWCKLKYCYTQQELANIIGSSRVTVAKLISKLSLESKIRILNHKIEIKHNMKSKYSE